MTMPSPRRVARQSVSVLMGMCMSKPDAARVVIMLCDEVTAIIWRRDHEIDLAWIANIAAEAANIRSQARPLPPPTDLEAAYDAAYPVVGSLLDRLNRLRQQAPPERPGA